MAAITFFINLDLTPSKSVDCSQKSSTSDKAVRVVFNNETNRKVLLNWVEFDGNQKLYEVIPPSENRILDSFVGHTWCIREQESNNPIKFAVATDNNQTINIR